MVEHLVTMTGALGLQFRLWFRDSTRFRVFPLLGEDKPFRIVIDVSRPGGAAAEYFPGF